MWCVHSYSRFVQNTLSWEKRQKSGSERGENVRSPQRAPINLESSVPITITPDNMCLLMRNDGKTWGWGWRIGETNKRLSPLSISDASPPNTADDLRTRVPSATGTVLPAARTPSGMFRFSPDTLSYVFQVIERTDEHANFSGHQVWFAPRSLTANTTNQTVSAISVSTCSLKFPFHPPIFFKMKKTAELVVLSIIRNVWRKTESVRYERGIWDRTNFLYFFPCCPTTKRPLAGPFLPDCQLFCFQGQFSFYSNSWTHLCFSIVPIWRFLFFEHIIIICFKNCIPIYPPFSKKNSNDKANKVSGYDHRVLQYPVTEIKRWNF